MHKSHYLLPESHLLRRSFFRWLCALIALTLLSGCSLFTTQPAMTTSDRWAVIPIINQTGIPVDMTQLESHLLKALSETGIKTASIYTEPVAYAKPVTNGRTQAITDIKRRQRARQWMQDNRITYGISGELLTWKKDKQGRPDVMMNLSVTDTQTGQEIWTNSGYSEGRPQDNNFQVTQQLMETLLKLMPIQNQEDNLLPMP